MNRIKWTDKKFEFGNPDEIFDTILDTLSNTHPSLMAIAALVTEEAAARKPEGKWSIKEHIGHLTDLDELHDGRIDDFLQRKEILRPADMTNAKTNAANHNAKPLKQLLSEFQNERNNFISRLRKLDKPTRNFASLHPRLKEMMRPVDMAFFVMEHDAHHMESIAEICRMQ